MHVLCYFMSPVYGTIVVRTPPFASRALHPLVIDIEGALVFNPALLDI